MTGPAARRFGSTGLVVPVLGLGCGRLGDDTVPERVAAELVGSALDLGVVLFDAARSYGNAEERLGRLLAGARDRVVLSTKVGYGVEGVPDWTGACVAAGIDAALVRLRTEVIDIVHLHSCPLEVLRRGDVVEALGAAQRAGKIRVAAYSGEGEALEWAVSSDAFGAVQASVSVWDQGAARGVLTHAALRGLGLLAKRPLADAPWRFASGRPEAADLAIYWDRFRALRIDPCGLSWPELAVRWTAFHPAVSCTLVGTGSVAHLRAAAAAVAAGPLPAAHLGEIAAAFAPFAGTWHGVI